MIGRNSPGTQRVLYDGWALAYQPCTSAALHLLTLLELHPAGVQPVLALPASSTDPLPEGVATLQHPAENTPLTRLRWEQAVLPALANDCEARLMHLTAGPPPVWGRVPSLVSPTAFSEAGLLAENEPGPAGWASRLRYAASWGGLKRARLLLWPDDLPLPSYDGSLQQVPGVIHPNFTKPAAETEEAHAQFRRLTGLDVPETYVLYNGPTHDTHLRNLLSAWSWAAGPVGEYYPLIMVGEAGLQLQRLLDEYGLADSVRNFAALPLAALAALYQGCSLLFHPAPVPAWGDPLRTALSCGKPVVALETPRSAALVGPAAYLAPFDPGGRALGAALLSVIVDDELTSSLSQAACRRTEKLDGEVFRLALGKMYRSLLAERD